MHPSTDPRSDDEFAAAVLQTLLSRIDARNDLNSENPRPGYYVFPVSHAWSDGPMIFLVYSVPPSDVAWGLVRDTRRSIISVDAPWPNADEAALYYYLLDLEEGWPGSAPRQPGELEDAIRWGGHPVSGNLPGRVADIPDRHRHTAKSTGERRGSPAAPVDTEPRRYAGP